MARKSAQGDPALSIDFFLSGFYTHRSQLFAPFKAIGVNVVSFHDPVIDGANCEDTDLYEWQRRPAFSIFCPIPLADSEIVNEFYSSRNLNGQVIPFVDTNRRLATFTSTSLDTIAVKTTVNQGYISTIGNVTYYADGAAADLYVWDGTNLSAWGLAAPTVTPVATGLGFWQPYTSFALGNSILDTNGSIETVTAILIPNGAFESPASAGTLALAGSLPLTWTLEPALGGYSVVEGYQHIQQFGGVSSTATIEFTFSQDITAGNVIVLSFGEVTVNVIPTVISVSDNLGNVYTQQAEAHPYYAGGGGHNYYSNQWVWTAPVTVAGTCTVRVIVSAIGVQITAHEFAGISDTASTTASNFVVHPVSFNTGTVGFSGTQLVLSSMFLEATYPGSIASVGYTAGANSFSGAWQLSDAYTGTATTASPTWSTPAGNGEAAGITLAFPISSLATGYSPYLFLYDFHNAIPSSATVVGIVVTIPKQDASLGAVQDYSVKLVVGGSVVGSSAASATAWSTTGYAVTTYGTPNNVSSDWGVTPTYTELNVNGASGFGIAISASITSIVGGSVVPTVGFTTPNQPTVTIYYKLASGLGGPGISGEYEPVWSTSVGTAVTDGGLAWTNYGNIQTWFPLTGYPTPVVILDANGNLQLSTYLANPIAAWDSGTTYANGDTVFFGGQYWTSLVDSNTGVTPATGYAVSTTVGSVVTTVPYWSITPSPLVTGIIAPVWNTTVGGTTVDGSYTWTNIGQGTGLAFVGYEYVWGFRTVYGHLTTSSPFSNNTGAILGPLNGSITGFTISADVVTFNGSNNFLPGNVFTVQGLTTGTYLNGESFTVISAIPSSSFPLTSVAVSGSDVLTITAINNLVVGQTVTFSGVGTATFLNGVTVTVISSGLSGTQFEADFTHGSYGPTGDVGTVTANGSWTAAFVHGDVSATLDSGAALPLIATLAGVGTGSPLCNSVATITAVSVTANVVQLTASNNFQPGIWVTITGLTGAAFLNGQQLQVIAVDQPVGTQNTWFQVYFVTPNYAQMTDAGTATFNAVEIYRTSDGGGTYLFDGAITNPGANVAWTYNDFVPDTDLNILLIAPLYHQNDPPPGALGSSTNTPAGNILAYWQGRLWMVVGHYVYFDAGPDCYNGIPEQSWPPGNRFQFAGPVLGIEPTPDGVGLLVFLADRVNAIVGGPETISFYPTDALSNFGISNPNALFRDGSVIGTFTTQQQYFELAGLNKSETGEHIADYLTENFLATKTYVTMHRNGLDVGTFLSNGVDQVLRYGTNIGAWSVPAYPACGAGALRSIETSVGINSLMLASPTGGITTALGPANPSTATSVGTGTAWANPSNITLGNPISYATVTFTVAGTSQILRAAYQLAVIPTTAVVQGVQVQIVGKQSEVSGDLTLTISPTNAVAGAESHTFAFGLTNTTINFGNSGDLWGMPWNSPLAFNTGALSFDITTAYTGAGTPEMYVAEVQVTVTYQNPGNYLYARDVNSWGDSGTFGENNGTPYSECNVVVGSITLSPLGAPMFELQHVVGYFDAVGTLNFGAPSQPTIWVLPNEVNDTQGVGFQQLPEVIQEPPIGQNHPSKSLLALRWPVNMVNSFQMSQMIHHLQVKIQFEPENAPNTLKALAFKSNQD